ncbi:hypothetical protein YC2023_102818 [Brassica napus]
MPRYSKPKSHVMLIILPVPNQLSNQKKVELPLLTSQRINQSELKQFAPEPRIHISNFCVPKQP